MAAARGGFRFGLRCDSSLHGDARHPFARRSLGLRGLSRQAARRGDLQHGGYRPIGLFAVLHAKRVVPRPPARAGGRAEDVELPEPVWHDRRPDRQPYPRHARPSASLAPAARLRPNPGYATPARWAAWLPTARRPCADRADGTEYVCSQKLGCPQCLTRRRGNGKTENYHAMLAGTVVAPGHAMALPMMPEFIA